MRVIAIPNANFPPDEDALAAADVVLDSLAEPTVEAVGDLLTMQLGPEQVLLNVAIKFRRGLNVQQLESTIENIERRIRAQESSIKRIFIEAESLTRRTPESHIG